MADRGHFRLHHLSTGQRARLGFAISTAVQPDILLMDEWIITGDAAFIERARERMLGRFRDSRIVVLASHSTALLRELCNKALVLDQGRMRFYGDIGEGLEVYREIVSRANANLRRDLAQADPLLFGDTVGLVERITVLPGRLQVEGWAMAGKQREVGALTVEVAGRRLRVPSFERVDRDDVRRHLGRGKGAYGFRFQVPVHLEGDERTVVARVAVTACRSDEDPGIPLPLASGAVVEVASGLKVRRG